MEILLLCIILSKWRRCYINNNRVFELFNQSAEEVYSDGIGMLGYCYYNEIG